MRRAYLIALLVIAYEGAHYGFDVRAFLSEVFGPTAK